MMKRKRLLKKLQEKLEEDHYEVFYQDEVHFKLTLSIIRAWFLAGTCPEIKSPTERFKMSVSGAMGKSGQLITLQSTVFNAVTFKLFLEKLVCQAEDRKSVV